jgi:hypothetical protein
VVDIPVVCDVPFRLIDLHALLSRLKGGECVDLLLEGGVVSLEVFGLKVVSDVAGMDGGGEAVCNGSDEVGDALGFDDLEDAER